MSHVPAFRSGEPARVKLSALREEALQEIELYWNQAHPLDPMPRWMLHERLFGPPAPDPELLIAARDAAGRLLGLAAGVYPCRRDGVGGVRWIGTLPDPEAEAALPGLLDELCRRLRARGAGEIHLFATPPHYIRPGVDVRKTGLIARLLDLGWRHAATHCNMTCDLSAWSDPGEAAIFGVDGAGCRVRRAVQADLAPLRALIERHWTPGWRDATSLGFAHDPVSVFVAEEPGGELAGFSAYEVDQCLGTFGPTGVLEDRRGLGLGRRLLWAVLWDLRRLGRAECQIGWIGPVGFYHRACGAQIGPVHWMLSRVLTEPV